MGPLNDAGVAEKMDEHVADALKRGADAGQRAAHAATGFPTDLYWQPTVLDNIPADALVARRRDLRPDRARRRDRLAGGGDRADERVAVRAASVPAIFTRDLSRGLRYTECTHTGWVNVNDSSNYWESHLPFGGRSGTADGIGRVGGTAPMETFAELQTVVLSN